MNGSPLLLTFTRVHAYLQQTGRSVAISPGGGILQCQYTDATVSAQVAMRAVSSNAGSNWLAISVPIGPAVRFGLRAALVANDAFVVGALGEYDGIILIRQTLPLQSVSFAQLELGLRELVHTSAEIATDANRMREASAVGGTDQARFGYLVRRRAPC